MKRALLFLSVCLTAAGCSDSKVVVRASLAEGGEAIAEMPVYLLPYDRRALMDSLARASEEPEPTIPADLVTQLESLNAAPRVPGDSTARANAAMRTVLQARIDSIRAARVTWRQRVYAPFDSVARAKESELAVKASADTTDAAGRAAIPADEGRFWIYATYVLPETTLEWNLPVSVRGDSVVVSLTRKNAKEQQFF
jgi:hypothetical protein